MNEWMIFMNEKTSTTTWSVCIYKYIHASIENEWMEYEQNRKTGSTD